MFSGIQKHHGGQTMTELEKAADNFFPIDEKEMSLDEQSDQLLRQIGFKFGAKWQYEQFEKNRLTACDNMTKEEFDREQEFTTDFIEKNNRIPTYSDAIEYGRESMRERLTKLKELTDKMYYAAQYLTTDASKLRKAMRDYWHYVVYELKKE